MPQPDTSAKRHEEMLQRLQSELSSTASKENGEGKIKVEEGKEERLRELLREYEDKCTDYG